jgi:glycosyltransferase involved in cell wall biosynthesis
MHTLKEQQTTGYILKKISILIPCFNEEKVMPLLRQAIETFLPELTARQYQYEVILIDDGSQDMTWCHISDWVTADPSRIRGIALSRNFGHQAALSCGYETATGDVIVSIDADLQDPLPVILEMLDKYEQGADIVLGVRRSREAESTFKKMTAKWYYQILHLLGMKFVEKDCGDFRLMNRRSVNALNCLREKNRMLRAMVGWTGFKVVRVYFDRQPRAAGSTKYPLKKMLILAIDGIISFTSLPLRIAYWLASVISLTVFCYLLYTLIRYWFFNGDLVHGWTSIILTTTAFGFVNLICLGLIGEYIGRIYEEVKNRPLYLVHKDSHESSL